MKIKLLILAISVLSTFNMNAKNDVLLNIPTEDVCITSEEVNGFFQIVVVYNEHLTAMQRNSVRLAIWAQLEADGHIQFSRLFGTQGNTETWMYWFTGTGHPGNHTVKDAVIDTDGIDVCEGDPSDCID